MRLDWLHKVGARVWCMTSAVPDPCSVLTAIRPALQFVRPALDLIAARCAPTGRLLVVGHAALFLDLYLTLALGT